LTRPNTEQLRFVSNDDRIAVDVLDDLPKEQQSFALFC
jgi:hypothetical protein